MTEIRGVKYSHTKYTVDGGGGMYRVNQILLATATGLSALISWTGYSLSHEHTTHHVASALTLHIKNKTIAYDNYDHPVHLQEDIDQHPTIAGTCHFQVPQDNNDGKSSYFAGHDNAWEGGCFEVLKTMSIGDPITVTDMKNTTHTYHIAHQFIAGDDPYQWSAEQFQHAFESNDEQIVLQVCMTDDTNLITIAK
jgi:hypothetical protein